MGRSARNERREALGVLSAMFRRIEESFDERDEDLLLTYSSDLEGADADRLDRLDRLFELALDGFLHSAAAGVRLEVPDRIGEAFGDSIDDNYPGAGAGFRRLAESYWSLKMLEARVAERHSGIALQQLLLDVVTKIERTFFEEPTAHRPAERLAADQRTMLEGSSAPLDVEELLMGNPLLVGNPLA